MLHRRPSASELRGARPVFLLEVFWLGRVYRFCTEPLLVTKADGTALRFGGSLDLRSLQDSLSRSDGNPQGGTASMSVVFPELSLMREYLEGRILEGAVCELSMVFVRGGIAATIYEDRLIQLRGHVSRPQIGFHDRPEGFAGFTVTARPFDTKTPILNPSARLSSVTIPGTPSDYYGAMYPLVFGSPGNADIPGSPAYTIDTTPGDRRTLIAVGRLDADEVTISDEDGTYYVRRPVLYNNDSNGILYAYVSTTNAPSGFTKSTGKHFIHWVESTTTQTTKYALSNPFGAGGLHRATDLARYLLGLTGAEVDDAQWVSSAPLLDRYTFSGYVNDASVTVWDFMSAQMLPLMPLQVRVGAHGLYPVSLLPSAYPSQLPQLTVEASRGLEQVSPVQITQELRDIVNQMALSYLYNAREDRLTAQLVSTPDEGISNRTRSTEAQRSREIYGERPGPDIEATYLADDSGAQHALRWLLYDRGFLHMAVQLRAAPRYGWLMVGDEVSLTASALALSGRRATVTSKQWDGSSWRLVLAWSLAPLEATF
jgi:hypothetical protein